VSEFQTICNGPFATVLPKVCDYVTFHDCDRLKHLIQVRSILGPSVSVSSVGYGASESLIGLPHANKLDEFVLPSDDIVEFLDLSLDATHENIRQPVSISPPILLCMFANCIDDIVGSGSGQILRTDLDHQGWLVAISTGRCPLHRWV